MKSIIEDLDKAFSNKLRLGIMAILVVNEWVDYNTLKELLGGGKKGEVTDGNLASHLRGLEKVKLPKEERKDPKKEEYTSYIEYKKEFVGKKTRTSYRCTPAGKAAFEKHLQALEDLIRQSQES